MIGKLKTVAFDAADMTGLADFYVALAGWTKTDVEDDWITMSTPDGWQVAVQLAPDHVPPRWPDPAHPQQFHLDLRVPDIDAAAMRAEALGATRLGGGESWHTLADPAGHPFDLCKGDDAATSIYAVTIDCPDAKALSHFYADALGMEILYEGDVGSLIGAEGRQVMFQNVADYTAPRWPDPAHPQQVHLDVRVDYSEITTLEERLLALGATRLPGEGENWRVYADPAGHPFCLTG
jgi:catechol-2,3-dioxygenase